MSELMNVRSGTCVRPARVISNLDLKSPPMTFGVSVAPPAPGIPLASGASKSGLQEFFHSHSDRSFALLVSVAQPATPTLRPASAAVCNSRRRDISGDARVLTPPASFGDLSLTTPVPSALPVPTPSSPSSVAPAFSEVRLTPSTHLGVKTTSNRPLRASGVRGGDQSVEPGARIAVRDARADPR